MKFKKLACLIHDVSPHCGHLKKKRRCMGYSFHDIIVLECGTSQCEQRKQNDCSFIHIWSFILQISELWHYSHISKDIVSCPINEHVKKEAKSNDSDNECDWTITWYLWMNGNKYLNVVHNMKSYQRRKVWIYQSGYQRSFV